MDASLNTFLIKTYIKLKVFDNHDLKFNINKDGSIFLKTTDLLYFIETELQNNNIDKPEITDVISESILKDYNIEFSNMLF